MGRNLHEFGSRGETVVLYQLRPFSASDTFSSPEIPFFLALRGAASKFAGFLFPAQLSPWDLHQGTSLCHKAG